MPLRKAAVERGPGGVAQDESCKQSTDLWHKLGLLGHTLQEMSAGRLRYSADRSCGSAAPF